MYLSHGLYMRSEEVAKSCRHLKSRDSRADQDVERFSCHLFLRLKGINVTTTHRADQKHRFKIGRVSRDTASSLKFLYKKDKNDESEAGVNMTIAQYFSKIYGVNVRFPNLPLVLKVFLN